MDEKERMVRLAGYNEGFQDGFMKAFDYVIQNANLHKSQFKDLYDIIMDKNQKD